MTTMNESDVSSICAHEIEAVSWRSIVRQVKRVSRGAADLLMKLISSGYRLPIILGMSEMAIIAALEKIGVEYEAGDVYHLVHALEDVMHLVASEDRRRTMDVNRIKMARELVAEAKRLMAGRNNSGYEFYVVVKDQIESGWEYKEDAQDQKAEIKPSLKPKVVTLRGLQRFGLDPDDDSNWMSGPQNIYASERVAKKITMDKVSDRGGALYLVKEDGVVLGFLKKTKDTRDEQLPWQAFEASFRSGGPIVGKLIDSFFGRDGQKQAIKALKAASR